MLNINYLTTKFEEISRDLRNFMHINNTTILPDNILYDLFNISNYIKTEITFPTELKSSSKISYIILICLLFPFTLVNILYIIQEIIIKYETNILSWLYKKQRDWFEYSIFSYFLSNITPTAIELGRNSLLHISFSTITYLILNFTFMYTTLCLSPLLMLSYLIKKIKYNIEQIE